MHVPESLSKRFDHWPTVEIFQRFLSMRQQVGRLQGTNLVVPFAGFSPRISQGVWNTFIIALRSPNAYDLMANDDESISQGNQTLECDNLEHAVYRWTRRMTAGPMAVTPETSYRIQFALLSERIASLKWITGTIIKFRKAYLEHLLPTANCRVTFFYL